MSNFITDLFGTIAGGSGVPAAAANLDFIPDGYKGETINLKGLGKARWMGLRNKAQQKRAYEFCFALSTVIDRLAEYDLTGHVEIFRKDGKGANKVLNSAWADNMRTRFQKPNHLQGWYQFRGQQLVYKRVFGWVIVLPIIPAGFTDPSDAVAWLNIPTWCVEPISNRVFIAGSLQTVLKGWKVTILGKTTVLEPDQVLLLQDGFYQDESRDFLVPQSKLVGIDMAVSNLCLAMEADNVLLKKKGPLGFISHDAAAVKDSQVGYIPMSKKERADLQRDLQRYGLSLEQYQYVISRTAAKWVPMSFDSQQLRTKETVLQSEKIICHRFAYPYILYEETETTYANGDNAAATVYQTNIIPNALRDFAEYNNFFKAKDQNAEMRIDFSHVAALQEDEQFKATAMLTTNQACEILWNNNMITMNQWLERAGFEPLGPAGELYKKDADAANTVIDIPVQQDTPPQLRKKKTLRIR